MIRALVTGSSGFVGRHMVRRLLADGWHVDECDLAEKRDARNVFRACRIKYDLVVHCAYHVGGRAQIDGNPSLLALNLELDSRLFEWAVRTDQHRVLYYSSSAAYPRHLQTDAWSEAREFAVRGMVAASQEDGSTPSSKIAQDYLRNIQSILNHLRLREDDIDLSAVEQPDARYGWAKLTGEHLAASASELGLRVHVVRPFSGYGEDQNPDEYPFPAIVRRASSGDMTVWGPPGQCRDWIHIDDVISGSLAVVEANERRPVNLCTGVGTSFGDLATRVAEIAGVTHGDVVYDQTKPTGVMFRVGDPTRMKVIYDPVITLDEGIRRAVAQLGA